MSDILSEIDQVLSVNESEVDDSETPEENPEDGKNDTSTEETTEDSEEGKKEDSEDTDGESEKPKGEKPKKENGVQKRIDELTREKYELRRLLDEAKKSNQNNEPQLPPKPIPNQFRTERDYRDAVVEYNTTVKHIEAEQVKEKERASEIVLQNVANKIQADKSKFKDFDTVVRSISHIPMDEALTDVILDDKNGIDVLYFLGQNPSIAEEISNMSQTKRARTLGILSAKLEGKKTGKQVSSAPKPPSKVAGSAKKEKHPGDMTPEEYSVWRRKQK